MSALPNRDRRAERREATRREILDAAWVIARRDGLSAITLREVAASVGMRSPSLYSHFASKNAIYDAMFGQAWTQWCQTFEALDRPSAPRRSMLAAARAFFDFAASDLARYQLMSQRTIPDFEPSREAYAASLAAYEQMRTGLSEHGVRSQADLDLWTGMIAGFVDQQLANDPGGTRWRRLLPRMVDMFCDETGIPGPTLRRSR